MIVYQVKVTIQAGVESDWLHWMRTVHIPDVIATGLVSSYQLWQPEEGEPHTYYFSYWFASREILAAYERDHAPRLRADPQGKFPDQFQASRQIFEQL